MAKAGRGGFGTTLVLAVLLVVVSLAAGVGLTLAIWNPPTGGGGNVVLGIRQLNELATVEQTVQSIVVVEENETIGPVTVPGVIAGEKLLLVATGEVEAGVDLDELREDDVRVVGKRVTIDLPEARILGSSLDEDGTRVYDRDQGLVKFGVNDELVEVARRRGEDNIVETARESGILGEAEQNAEESIRGLILSLGYEKVSFERGFAE
jgi:hypothetical protein